MSFVGKKDKLFRDKPAGYWAALARKRSEGRMKRIDSCPDNRAWCMDDEERRKYFLELIENPPMGGDSAAGRYVPVGALIDSLQATKNAQIDALAQQVADLERQLEAYRSLDLTDEQREQLEKLLKGVKSSKKVLDDAKKKASGPVPGPAPKPDAVSIAEPEPVIGIAPAQTEATPTQVLFKRDDGKMQDDADSSGAESDMDESELKKLLLRKESQIISLKNQLAAKDQELAEKDAAMRAAMQKVDNASGRVDENSELRKQMEQFQAELENQKASSALELERMRQERDALSVKVGSLGNIEAVNLQLRRKSDNMDDLIAERDMLRMRLKDYENVDAEMENLKYRAKEADVLRMERDRLQDRNDELATIEAAYLKLLEETKDYETLAAERQLYRSKHDDMVAGGHKVKDQAMKDLEQERDSLIRDLKEYECAIADQEDEIKRLLLMVEKLSATTNSKEDRMQKGLSDMRLQMDKKDERISLLENQLAELPNLEAEIKSLRDQLKNTIVGVAQEKNQLDNLSKTESKLRADLNSLEAELQKERALSKSLKDELNALRSGASGGAASAGKSNEDELMAQINALQKENDALKVSMEALRSASGGDKQLEEELVRERKARMYAEEMCREAKDALEKMTADKDKALNEKIGAAAPNEKELIAHSEKKYEEEKKAKDMLQGVLDFTQDELENEKVARRKCEERIKQLEQALADQKGAGADRKDGLDMANELEQLRKQNEMLKKSAVGSKTDLKKSSKLQLDLSDKVQALEKQIKELQAENAALKKSDAARDEQEKVLRLQLESIQDLLKEEQNNAKIREQLNDKVKALEAENAEMKKGGPGAAQKPSAAGADDSLVKALEQKIKALEAENASVKAAKPGAAGADDSKISTLEKRIKDLEAENAELKKGQKPGAAAAAGADDSKVKALEQKLKALEAENDGMKKAQTGSQTQITNKFKDLENKIKQLESENAALKASQGAKPAAGKADEGGAGADLLKRVQQLEAENAKLKKENEDLEKNLKNKANELQTANDNLKRIQLPPSERAKFDEELDARNKAEKDKMEAIIKQLEGQVKSLSNKSPASDKTSDSRKKSIDAEEQKRMKQLEDEVKLLRSGDKSGASAAAYAEIDRLEKKCAKLEAEIQQLRNDKKGLVDSYEKRIAGLTESFENRLKMKTQESMLKLQESFEKFKHTLSPEDHAANIKAVEEKSEKKFSTMKAEYEKRIADMMAANTATNKVYNANLSTLKQTYERDMKLLNERHNASVTRLQGLHEEEVVEINNEYESELKALKDSQGGVIDEVKKNHEETVKAMKKKHQEEMENLRKKQKEGVENMSNNYKKETRKYSGTLDDDFDRAKLEHEAELQRLKDSNRKKIETLKVKYAELMEEERRKNGEGGRFGHLEQSRTEVYELRPLGDDYDKQVGIRGASLGGPSVEDILRKALQHGFDSLSFEELSLLHERCCSSTARMILENPALKLAPMKFTLQGADKQQLCSRIACLEQEIARRQFETQKRVNILENTVKHEKRRLCEVKDALTRSLTQEQRRSLELHSRLGTQTQQQAEIESERDMLRRQLAYHEEKAMIAIQQLEKEKSKNRIMEEDLHKERNNIKHLQSLLEAERSRAKSSNLKESDLIETLRIKLETALDNEARMKFKYEKLEALYNSSQVPTNQSPRVQIVPTNQSPRRPGSAAAPCHETCPAPCNQPTRLNQPYTELQVRQNRDRADRQKEIFMQECSTRFKQKKRQASSNR